MHETQVQFLGWGFPCGSAGKESACNAGDLGSTQVALVVKKLACQYRRHKRCRFNPWGGKSPWRRKWQLTPVFLPGESHGIEKAGRLQSTGLQRVGHDWSNLAHTWAYRTVDRPGEGIGLSRQKPAFKKRRRETYKRDWNNSQKARVRVPVTRQGRWTFQNK